jgi:hypothetical protein
LATRKKESVMKTVSLMIVLYVMSFAACAGSATSTDEQGLCTKDSLSGLCTGDAATLANDGAMAEAQAENPGATDLSITLGCTSAGAAQGGRAYSCGVKANIAGATVALVCGIVVRGGEIVYASCAAKAGRQVTGDTHRMGTGVGSETASVTGGVDPKVCTKDRLSGLCPGVAIQAAQGESLSEAANENPGATDLSIVGECEVMDAPSGHGRIYTCGVKLILFGEAHGFGCVVLIQDGVITDGGCVTN